MFEWTKIITSGRHAPITLLTMDLTIVSFEYNNHYQLIINFLLITRSKHRSCFKRYYSENHLKILYHNQNLLSNWWFSCDPRKIRSSSFLMSLWKKIHWCSPLIQLLNHESLDSMVVCIMLPTNSLSIPSLVLATTYKFVLARPSYYHSLVFAIAIRHDNCGREEK